MNKSELQYQNRLLQERVETLEKYIKAYVTQAEKTIDALMITKGGDLKEQMQENLLTYFDSIAWMGPQHTQAMYGMCDVIIKTINEHGIQRD